MRPRALAVTAFGPFGGTVRVDFESLSRRSLFLIHGATGAGKTTLLDAICFALYGVTSGGERSVKEMRSHHASDRTKTEVSFDFDVRGKRYRVERVPEQDRPRTKGSGTTTVKSQATLLVRTADLERKEGEPREDGARRAVQGMLDLGLDGYTTLATKAGDVEAQIVDLLGLTADQFRQVAVLPQGRFRALLLASSRERQAILESLFGTERYRRVEDALRQESADLKQAITAEEERSRLLKDQVGLEGTADPVAELTLLEEVARELAGELLVRGGEVDEARRRAEESRAFARAEQEALAARSELALLEDERASREAARERLAVASRAADVLPAQHRLVDAEAALHAAEGRHRRAEELLGAVRTEREAAHSRALVERSRSGEQEEMAARRQRLAALEEKLAAWTEANARLLEARQASEASQQKRAEAESALLAAGSVHAASADALDEARLLAGQVEARRAAYVRVLQARKVWLRREEVNEQSRAQQQRMAALIDDVARAEDDLAAADAARDRAETAFLRGQAAELARALKAGEACPVCGSHEHPHPAAVGTAADDLSRQRMQSARQTAEKAREAFGRLGTDLARVEVELLGLKREAALLAEQLDDRAAFSREELEAELDRSARAVEASEDAFDRLDVIKAAERAAAEAVAQKQRALDEAKTDDARSASRLTELGAVAEERAAGLPEAMRDPAAVKDALQKVDDEQRALEEARSTAEKSLATSERKLATAEEAFRHAQVGLEEAGARVADARSVFDQALAAGAFDEVSFAAARMEPEERARVESEVATWAARLASATDRLARADEAHRKITPPALGVDAAAEEAEASARYAEVIRRQADTFARRQQLERAAEGVSDAARKAAALDERYRVVGRLAEVALGEGRHRITFQRFVLATLLDEVLQTANERLAHMSRGRYRLRRAQGTSRRKAQGLDLSVVDQHTGTERPAATLSGGESFLAALALALGLADAVRARAGGRPLEAIFIDEGFGGLDPEALDLALEALGRLKDTGRTVGIISHVGELKERVEAQLLVKPGRRGARVVTTAG